jgi:endonuclease III
MSLKRGLRSAANIRSIDSIVTATTTRSRSQDRIFKKSKRKTKARVESPSEDFENPPAKRAKGVARANLADPILTEINERKETNSAPSNHARTLLTPQTELMNWHSTSTADDFLKQACDHLINVDARLKPLVQKYPCPIFSSQGLAEEIDPFQSLCSGIISQQISGAAATSVKKKFVGLFYPDSLDHEPHCAEQFPLPVEVAACDIPFLRGAGLSQRKAEYIKGLAEHFVCGSLSTEILIKATDEEVLQRLTAVRGLGKWSVEMFTFFGLKRMDVFSTGDLGVQYVFSFF